MDVSWTFGSVGDLIAICQLVGQALGTGHGSSTREYRELRKELDNLVHILTLLHESTQSPCISVQAVQNRIRSVTDDCCSLMQEISDRLIPRYGKSLGFGGLRRPVYDTLKKLEFRVREQGRLREFRERLATQVANLTVLIGVANGGSIQANTSRLGMAMQQLTAVGDQTQQQLASINTLAQELASANDIIFHNFNGHEHLLAAIANSVSTVSNSVTQTESLSTQILGNIIQALQQANADSVIHRSLDPTRELPVTLEDSTGSCVSIPTEWTADWEDLFILLGLRFKGHKGHGMVVRREFALEEHITEKDLDQTLPLKVCFRRGMKINMSMIFSDQKIASTSCPRCQTHTDAPEGVLIQCRTDFCGMWFRIVSPIREAFNRDVTEEPALEEERASTLSPADFQRVRLVVPTIMEETSGPGEILLDQDMMREPIIEKDLGHGNCDSSSTKGEQEQILSTFAEVNHATTEPTICINANSITVISHQAAIAPPSSGGHSLSIDPAKLSSSNYYSTSSRYSDGYRNGNTPSAFVTNVREIKTKNGGNIVLISHNRT